MLDSSDHELYHYGIKGMKWGVRRNRKSSGRFVSKRQVNTDGWSDDAKTAHAIRQKTVKQMSNAEIRKVNERIRLENEYAQLNPSLIARGKKKLNAYNAMLEQTTKSLNQSQKLIKLGKKMLA